MALIRLGLLILACTLGKAAADDLQVIISGKAIHLGGPSDLNEDNFGLGLQYDFDTTSRWIPVINLATLRDSNDNLSTYIGAGTKRRFRLSPAPNPLNFDAGIIGLVMTRKGYNDGDPFFGAIPFVSFGNDWGGINLTYVPAVEETAYPFWYFQFALKLAEF